MSSDFVRQMVLNNSVGRKMRNYRNLAYLHWSGRLSGPPSTAAEGTLACVVRQVLAQGLTPENDFILRRFCYDLAHDLEVKAHATYALDAAGRLTATIGDLTARLQGLDDLVALSEVFGTRLYAFDAPRPTVVWDVGMHVGFASLFFAQLANVQHVDSYEPFAPTYRAAMENLALNPQLAGKITPHPYGLSDWNGNAEVAYDPDYKAGVSLSGLPRGVKPGRSSTQETIEIRSAVEVFDALRAAYPDFDVVAKIDCEGQEYKILPALHQAGRLAEIRLVLLEWHHEGPGALVRTLTEAGFEVTLLDAEDAPIGMLRAASAPFVR